MSSNLNGDSVKRHLDCILASPGFVRSKRLGAFLSWIVRDALDGNAAAITERNIAMEVYGRPRDFDPKLDGIVRAEAIRLRHKLREYYDSVPTGGKRIEVPKGTYVPVFEGFESPADSDETVPGGGSLELFRQRLRIGLPFLLAAGALSVLASTGWLLFQRAHARVDVSRLVAEANRRQTIGDMYAAEALLEEAVAVAPNAVEPHLARALVFDRLGHSGQAGQELAMAEKLGTSDPRVALEMAIRARQLNHDSADAAKLLQKSLQTHPGSLELYLELARSEGATEDLATIQAARRLPESASNPELDRVEALALGFLGRNPEAIAIALRGERKATALHATYMQARLMVLEGGLRANNGEGEAADQVLKRARELCLFKGDEICVAQTYRIEANRIQEGDHRYEEALRLYRQGLTRTRPLENWGETGMLMEGIAAALQSLDPKFTATDFLSQSFEKLSGPSR